MLNRTSNRNTIIILWMENLFIRIGLSILFCIAFLHSAMASEAGYSSHSYTITKITDGDSLRAGDIRIRLHGIDAPEIRQSCHNPAPYKCGEFARDYLIQALGEQATLRCQHIDTDRYERLIMRCYYRGIDINAAIVRAGWAVAYKRYSNDYVADEAEARAAKRGLWAGTFQQPEKWRRNN